MLWLNFGIALLKVVLAIFDWAQRQNYIDQGRREVISETLVAIAEKAKVKDQIRVRIDAMSDAEVDDALRNRGT